MPHPSRFSKGGHDGLQPSPHDQIAGEIVDFHQCSASGYSSRKNANGEESVWCRNCPTQAKIGIEWATRQPSCRLSPSISDVFY